MYRISGVKIKKPLHFSIEHYNITDAKRNAAGTMNMDLIAKKRKFILVYPELSGEEVEHILSLIDTNKVMFPFEYPDNGVIKTAIVYSGAITRKLHRNDMGWYWVDVSFNLIER